MDSNPGAEPRADPRPGRLVVAMSGGVDSSVAAMLLQSQGRELVGMYMRNGVKVPAEESNKKSCCSLSDARDARMVAAGLGIPFHSVDLSGEFGEIVRYFLREYARGRTPNPCAVCNRDLKMGKLIEFARELGAEGVATGHYARLEVVDGRVHLVRGLDAHKDQSYQLFSVAEDDLRRTHLPLGGLRKSEVRQLARERGLRTSEKKDSQEICFVPKNDYRLLLEEHAVPLHGGELVDTSGKVLGRHAGTEHYTIGQRRGHGVGGGEPLYVVELRPEEGRVVLGTRAEGGVDGCSLDRINWIGLDEPASGELRVHVQHRHRSRPAAAVVSTRGRPEVAFDEPELAVTPGQGAAFYIGDRLVGGGWIDSTRRARREA
jgi:tRNA-specific 2-thiouridylase